MQPLHSTVIEDLVRTRNPQWIKRPVDDTHVKAEMAALLDSISLDEYGRWVYYPWSGKMIHLPSLTRLVQIYAADSQKAATGSRPMGTPKPTDVQQLQRRRIQRQIQVAVRETSYYAELFAQNGFDVQAVTAGQLSALPNTSKADLSQQPGAFVRCGFQPTLCTMTTGTTGQGNTNLFTTRESQIFATFKALGLLQKGEIGKADIVQMSTSARALLGNQTSIEGYRQAGALVYQTSIVEPAQALALLANEHRLPGRKNKVSVLSTYPSYLGKLVETEWPWTMAPMILA